MSNEEKGLIARIVHNWRRSYAVEGGINVWLERSLGRQPTEDEHNYALECIESELRRDRVIK